MVETAGELPPSPPVSTEPPAPGGHSHTLPVRVCAAQRGRDFEVPDLERGIHFRDVSRKGYKKLWITALSSA